MLTDNKEKTLIVGHCLLVSLIMLDQIPNHSENPLFWFLAGGLIGRYYHVMKSRVFESAGQWFYSGKSFLLH